MTASDNLNDAQFTYDRNIVGQVTVHGPRGLKETRYTRGSGLTHERHPADVPEPLYHGSRAELSEGDLVEPGHPGNFVSRMTHVYATTQAESDDNYKGARGYGSRVYQVQPTGWYGHRRDARGVEYASDAPMHGVVREVQREAE
jgi:hypothetical protein